MGKKIKDVGDIEKVERISEFFLERLGSSPKIITDISIQILKNLREFVNQNVITRVDWGI